MRKISPRTPKTIAKPNAAPKGYDEYLKGVSGRARSMLNKMRKTIRSVVPPGTTEGIGYGIPMFKYHGTLVYFAAFSNHCSLFPANSTLIAKFKTELKDYTTSKGGIQFPMHNPLPVGLIKKIVKARVAENKHKEAAS